MPKMGPTLHVSNSTVVNFSAQLPIEETGTLGSKLWTADNIEGAKVLSLTSLGLVLYHHLLYGYVWTVTL